MASPSDSRARIRVELATVSVPTSVNQNQLCFCVAAVWFLPNTTLYISCPLFKRSYLTYVTYGT